MANLKVLSFFLFLSVDLGISIDAAFARPQVVKIASKQDNESCPAVLKDSDLAKIPNYSAIQDRVTLLSGEVVHYTLSAGYIPVYTDDLQKGALKGCLFLLGLFPR